MEILQKYSEVIIVLIGFVIRAIEKRKMKKLNDKINEN